MPVEWDQDALVVKARGASLRALTIAANVLRSEIIRLIQEGPKTGREYRRRGVIHTASAPGEPPASDTGNLVQGVTVEVDPDLLTLRVNNSAAYALALEYGTAKMEARPYMRVALENKREEIEAILQQELGNEFGS